MWPNSEHVYKMTEHSGREQIQDTMLKSVSTVYEINQYDRV